MFLTAHCPETLSSFVHTLHNNSYLTQAKKFWFTDFLKAVLFPFLQFNYVLQISKDHELEMMFHKQHFQQIKNLNRIISMILVKSILKISITLYLNTNMPNILFSQETTLIYLFSTNILILTNVFLLHNGKQVHVQRWSPNTGKMMMWPKIYNLINPVKILGKSAFSLKLALVYWKWGTMGVSFWASSIRWSRASVPSEINIATPSSPETENNDIFDELFLNKASLSYSGTTMPTCHCAGHPGAAVIQTSS
jgi:hypothetical protein